MNENKKMGLCWLLDRNPGLLFLLGIAVIVAVVGVCLTVYEVAALYAPRAVP